jgi:hypothetical protein
MNKQEELIMQFDPRTIEHLGISLYSKLPTVLSELISNSYDADADKVSINFINADQDKQIIYIDDGEGMSFDEINQKYLLIGRNRRSDSQNAVTKKNQRKIIGKKGLGKLSVFGIAKTIEITTVKNNLKNSFIMHLDEILKSKQGIYSPRIIEKDAQVTENNYTKIVLKDIERKSPFDTNDIALNLSKKFLIFDEQFKVTLLYNNSGEILLTNEMKFNGIEEEFSWSFPTDDFGTEYANYNKIKGKILTSKTPIKDSSLKGIYLTSRGKIVNANEFYGIRDTDQFHVYVTGYLEVDFIDDLSKDVISTNRESLNWETNETSDLREYIKKAIVQIGTKWKDLRAQRFTEVLKTERNIDIDDKIKHFGIQEQKVVRKILKPILSSPSIETDRKIDLTGFVIDGFNFEAFREKAREISEIEDEESFPKLVEILKDWEVMEDKEFKKIAIGRVETIKQFEKYIDEDTKEIPTMHNFLKKFPWLLDAKLHEFEDEIRYSDILKEKFPERDLDEPNKRIDFLCSVCLNVLYIIEIKRTKHTINAKNLEQAAKYRTFLQEKFGNSDSSVTNIISFVVGGKCSGDRDFLDSMDTLSKAGKVYVKTYEDLLRSASKYHSEFIKKYDELYKES